MRTKALMAACTLVGCAGLTLATGLGYESQGAPVGGPEAAAVFGGTQLLPCPKDSDKWVSDPTNMKCDSTQKDTCTGAKPAMNNCNQTTLLCGWKCGGIQEGKKDATKGKIGVLFNPQPDCAQLGIASTTAMCQWDAGKGTCVCSQQQILGVICIPNPSAIFRFCAPPPSK